MIKIYYTKTERKAALAEIKTQLDKYLFDEGVDKDNRGFVIKKLAEKLTDEEITRAILDEKRRVDGRALDEFVLC